MDSSRRFITEPELYELFPDARIGILYLHGLKQREGAEKPAANLRENVSERLSARSIPYNRTENHAAWSAVFSALGIGDKQTLASHLALLKRFQSSSQLPQIHPLVDAYNHISALRELPVGGHDVSGITEVTVGKTTGEETFRTMNSDTEETVETGEWAYLDRTGKRVLTRNLVWRQSEYSKISGTPEAVMLPLDDFTGSFSDSELAGIAEELVSVLAGIYDFTWDFGVVSRYNNVKTLNPGNSSNSIKTSILLLTRPETDTTPESIDRFFDHKIDQVYPSADALRKALASGRRLSFYIGADATGPRLHLGHLIPVLKLRQLQQMGHRLIFLIGDFTARIGDPTDKTAARVMLSQDDVERNAERFRNQIARYIDFDDDQNPAELVFNSDWNKALTMLM
ncbi:MAG: Tyrosine--tRNA ligase [candidate division WS6 bacterium OLB20]|uniref:Tyrosine--tRNA ligase n=1 Tax=candidate division WS6 bacterium OLB20 TaxID=1617426 RepID=A0A136LY19_9BACT|nr:MAG: Tyrosine--tRNA ligase [candidate division WS6 bacterium OLB20]